jgi:hypothetical protein
MSTASIDVRLLGQSGLTAGVFRMSGYDPTRRLRKNSFCDAQCYFFRNVLALRRWPRSPHTDAFEEEAHGRLDALLHGLSRPRVA